MNSQPVKAVIVVTLKPSVFDPQGEAVKHAIHGLGMESVLDVRIGKRIEVELKQTTVASARKQLEPICRDLLSNPVIEDYHIEFGRQPASRTATKTTRTPRVQKKAEPKAETVSATPSKEADSDGNSTKKLKVEKKKSKKDKKKK